MNIQNKKLEVSYISIVLLRVMISLIFIVASLSHLLNTQKVVERIESASMSFVGNLLGSPEISVILAGVIMLIAGIALLIGFKSKYAAIILIAVLIPITITIQIGQLSTIGPLFKNVAILGGLLFFTINSNLKTQGK